MNIAVIGCGYVGLVTGACLSRLGNSVTCIDKNFKKIRDLRRSKIDFYEHGLKEIINNQIKKRSLTFSSNLKNIGDFEIIFICVDTPAYGNGRPNLKNFNNVIREILFLANSKTNTTIVIKSTVPVGTSDKIYNQIKRFNSEKNSDLKVLTNPEFLKEGSAVSDFMRPDRIILGANDKKAFKKLELLYGPLNKKSNKIILMSPSSAELAKLSSNAFLATKISFINEIARLADASNANIHEVRKGIGADKRIGNDFLYSGLGYGGSCFPKDIQNLINSQKNFNIPSDILSATKQVNEKQIDYFIAKINSYFKKNSIGNINFAVWGVAFKPETTDLRNSLSISLINELGNRAAGFKIYDPMCEKKDILQEIDNLKNVKVSKNKYSALNGCQALIIATEWKEFWHPDFKKLENKVIFDGRNILNVNQLRKYNIEYFGIGV